MRELSFCRWISGKFLFFCVVGGLGWLAISPVQAELIFTEIPEGEISRALFTVNNIWICLATILVFIMHLGFAALEAGLTRAKNTVAILFKNTLIPCIGILTYALCGFGLMYPRGEWMVPSFLGFAGWGILPSVADLGPSYADGGYTYWADFIFQAMLAATAATIVSGCVAERIKWNSFLIFSALFLSISYPMTGSWGWGGGWLEQLGFIDFAGATLVHAVGGFAGLAGTLWIGPRLGKYKAGKSHPLLGHNLPLATVGVFLLWFGWYGFNGGSVFSADPFLVSYVLVTTSLSAAAGAIGAMLASSIALKKPDLSMVLNGILAGLVGITAGADIISPFYSVIVGLLAGIFVIFSVVFLEALKVDDPVGAVSVHGIGGIWGTLAVAFFGQAEGISLGVQLMGVVAVGAFSFVVALGLFLLLEATLGVRVSAEEEILGLDIGEHGQEAYPDFQGSVQG